MPLLAGIDDEALTPSFQVPRSNSLPPSWYSQHLHLSEEGKRRTRNRILSRLTLELSEELIVMFAERTLEVAEPIIEEVVAQEGVNLFGLNMERGAESAAHRLAEGHGEKHIHHTINAHAHRRQGSVLIFMLRLIVASLGVALVSHLVHVDWHRAKHEQALVTPSRMARRFFLIALVLDLVDLVAHVMMVMELTGPCHIDHAVVHRAHYLGFRCAMAGIVAVVLGELTSKVQHASEGHHRSAAACTHKAD